MPDDISEEKKPVENDTQKLSSLKQNLQQIVDSTPNASVKESAQPKENTSSTGTDMAEKTKSESVPPQEPSPELTEVLMPTSQSPAQTANSGFSPTSLGPIKGGFGKKIGIILAALLLVIIVLFAISKIKTSRGGLVGKKGEITWWGLQDEASVVQPLIDEYEKDNPKIHITYIKQSNQDYRVRLSNSLASGKGPDIFEIHNSWPAMFSAELEAMPGSVMSAEDYSKTYYPVIANDMTTPGGIVGIPLEFDALTLYVNQSIFASAAKTTPKLWDDVIDLATSLTQRDPQGNIIQSGAALGITENIDYWPEIVALMMLQNGASLAVPNTPEGVQALTVYTQFDSPLQVWSGILPPSTIAFAQGKVAMYFGPTRKAPEIAKTNPSLRFRTITLPQLIKNKPEEPDSSYATYWVQSVWNRSVNKDEAWEFLKFISSKDSLEKLQDARVAVSGVGMPYPRIDMNLLQVNDPILGSVIALAPQAKSGYLYDMTYDGVDGINTQVDNLFAEAIKLRGSQPALDETAKGLSKVYASFGAPPK